MLVEVFTLTFLAEWGDRSQIATIGLAASSNVLGVTLGGCLGHAVCTGAAVAGGKGMATMISERAVAVRFNAFWLRAASACFAVLTSCADVRRAAVFDLRGTLAADATVVSAAARACHCMPRQLVPFLFALH